jgi:tungstate transport system substrate-binding protein
MTGFVWLRVLLIGALSILALSATGHGAERFITLASTTSTDNSGLFRYLLPKFTARTGIAVRVVAVGTGAALRLGARGDVDVVLVHAPDQEEIFVAAGHGIGRRLVMHNDFIFVGPRSDPARIAGLRHASEVLRRLYRAKAIFASRGDKSGTHLKERALWRVAELEPQAFSGRWYLETGSGMGATLNFAVGQGAYTLADRATWLAFKNKGELVLLAEGDALLANPYGVIVINPARHPGVKVHDAAAFAGWLTGKNGQAAIAAFRINGKQVFFPYSAPK